MAYLRVFNGGSIWWKTVALSFMEAGRGGGGRKRLVNLNGYVQLVVEVEAEDGN